MSNPKHSPYYILAGWLVDGSGGPVQKKVVLKIIDGRIVDIDALDHYCTTLHHAVTDLSSCTILPPFIDSHVHLSLSGVTNKTTRQQQFHAGYEDIRPVMSRHIQNNITHGVLAVRDAGDRRGYALRFKKEIMAENVSPVILKVSGKGWHRKGRYGGILGTWPEENEPLVAACCREDRTVDQIKIFNSGLISLNMFGKETVPQFDKDEILDVAELAEREGKKVMVHANGRLPVSTAIEGGCHSVEHGYFMGRENLARMAERRIFWVPTVFAMQAMLDSYRDGDKNIDPDVIKRNIQYQLEQLALAREYGVKVALGTDAGGIGVNHGEAVSEELKLFLQAGYSLPEAIRCASYNGARLLGIEHMGLIARNRPANFIAFRGMPDQFLKNAAVPEAIFIDGTPYLRDHLKTEQF